MYLSIRSHYFAHGLKCGAVCQLSAATLYSTGDVNVQEQSIGGVTMTGT